MWDEGGRRKEEGEEGGGVWPSLTVALPTIPIFIFSFVLLYFCWSLFRESFLSVLG